jgi:ABC-type spermidine/putrescine transport system permease subunit II
LTEGDPRPGRVGTTAGERSVVGAPPPAGRRSSLLSVRRRRRLASAARISFLVLVGLLLYGPLLLLAVFSFNNSIIIALPFEGFTTTWYRQILKDPLVLSALRNSLVIALVVTPLCLILGTLAAVGITRFRYRLRGAAAGLVGAPLVVPWLLIGVGALLFFSRLHIPLSLQTIGVMHVVAGFPLVTAIVAARLVRFDTSLEEAARDLGATQFEVLRYIVLPLVAPALAAAGIFAFSWSFNNFTISFFTAGFQSTFPIWVFSTLNHAKNVPIVNAISTLVAAIQVVLLYAAWRLSRRWQSRTAGDTLTPEMVI